MWNSSVNCDENSISEGPRTRWIAKSATHAATTKVEVPAHRCSARSIINTPQAIFTSSAAPAPSLSHFHPHLSDRATPAPALVILSASAFSDAMSGLSAVENPLFSATSRLINMPSIPDPAEALDESPALPLPLAWPVPPVRNTALGYQRLRRSWQDARRPSPGRRGAGRRSW